MGVAWLGAALGRVVSLVADGGYVERKNLVGVLFEASFGVLLLAGSPVLWPPPVG